MKDNSVIDFLSTMSNMSRRTAKEYAIRLNSFKKFVLVHYGEHTTIDNLIVKAKEGAPTCICSVFSSKSVLLNTHFSSNIHNTL
jgi:hypothetical protein